MPPTIIHIAVGIMFAFLFILGNIFPDLDKVFTRGFLKNKCYEGLVKESPQCKFMGIGMLHNVYLWIGLILFSSGCLLHIIIDYRF